jgi:hypothetical protein
LSPNVLRYTSTPQLKSATLTESAGHPAIHRVGFKRSPKDREFRPPRRQQARARASYAADPRFSGVHLVVPTLCIQNYAQATTLYIFKLEDDLFPPGWSGIPGMYPCSLPASVCSGIFHLGMLVICIVSSVKCFPLLCLPQLSVPPFPQAQLGYNHKILSLLSSSHGYDGPLSFLDAIPDPIPEEALLASQELSYDMVLCGWFPPPRRNIDFRPVSRRHAWLISRLLNMWAPNIFHQKRYTLLWTEILDLWSQTEHVWHLPERHLLCYRIWESMKSDCLHTRLHLPTQGIRL